MPSFDIVSKTDLAGVDNALANMTREMSQRYDFKNSQSRIERNGAEITLNADDKPFAQTIDRNAVDRTVRW